MTDKIFYNFPIAIFRQVHRPDSKGPIKHVEDAINEAVEYALLVAYQKLMPPQANPNEYNAGVFNELTDVMGFCVNDPKEALRRWAGVYREYKNYSVFVGVDKSLLFDFRDNLVYKTDFEIEQFLAVLAIRSIIGAGHGNMRVKHIPWHYVLSRMAGHEKAVNNLDTLHKFISKYASRRYHDKLIKALCERWHMQYYGTRLGKRVAPLFTFSQSIPLDTLAEIEAQLRRENREKDKEQRINANLLLKKAVEIYIKNEKIGREIEEGIEPAPPDPGEMAIPLPLFGSLAGDNKTDELW